MTQPTEIKDLFLGSTTGLTLADRRLYNYLLHHSIALLPERLDFETPFTALEGVYGSKTPQPEQLKVSVQRLLRTLIEFKTSGGKWVTFALLAHAELHERTEKLYYAYSHHCRVLFTHPVLLEKCLIQAHFTQKYSKLLYEILSEPFYRGKGSLSIPVAELRDQLHITNTKLINFSDLDRFALLPALHEINAYAGFAVKYHTERKGMKVIRVNFEMTGKKNICLTGSAHHVIPEKRPRLFIDNPEAESVYAFLLNAETKERRKFFNIARENAAKNHHAIDEENFDRPDLWFAWIKGEFIKKQ
ncbi:MAG: hypothetical protein A3F41_04140 [Coxiella sp. RIFCSPHIGHO2_12_FULL_44_14]|nr:MAG: hypothetical protein A3F41_04140 [Coxiella sp. RIFCSPHIGHO2_12_FULL_44_14]